MTGIRIRAEREARMTKKDYVLIADQIRYAIELSRKSNSYNAAFPIIRAMAVDMCEALRQDNPRFDDDKFREACGIGI